MKKNSKKTFSQRAQDLVRKYRDADHDPIQKKELDDELKKLQQEQELYKQTNKIGEYSDEAMAQKAMQQQQMMAQQQSQMQSQGQFPQGQPQMQTDSQVGQMPQFDGVSGTSYIGNYFPQQQAVDNNWNMVNSNPYIASNQPNGVAANNNNSLGVLQSQGQVVPSYQIPLHNWQTYAGQQVPGDTYNIGGNNVKMTNPDAFNSKIAIDVSAKAPQPTISQDQQIGQTQSILPSVIAGGIGMIGNSLLAAGVRDNQFNQSYGADQISLAKERERLSREATTARNIGMRNLSGAGSRGAYLAGAGNVSAGVNQQLGDALSQSYFKEGMTNLQQREKAAELNRQVAMMNYQAKVNAQNERKGYLAAAAGIPAQTMQDIGNINYQNSALLSSGTDNYIAGVNGKSNPWKSQQIYRKFKK
jgi:hypothetical protein